MYGYLTWYLMPMFTHYMGGGPTGYPRGDSAGATALNTLQPQSLLLPQVLSVQPQSFAGATNFPGAQFQPFMIGPPFQPFLVGPQFIGAAQPAAAAQVPAAEAQVPAAEVQQPNRRTPKFLSGNVPDFISGNALFANPTIRPDLLNPQVSRAPDLAPKRRPQTLSSDNEEDDLASERGDPDPEEVRTVAKKLYETLRGAMDIQPTVVRLIFHDCVGHSCDGCINANNPDNFGLEKAINQLEQVYLANEFDKVMSRADFWQLAGLAAVEIGIEENNKRCRRRDRDCWMPTSMVPFKVGRKDCPTSPQSHNFFHFPTPTMSRQEMMDYFADQFGLDEFEVTALMGAHALGGAKRENSGYHGNWTTGETNRFNPGFYKLMLRDSMNFSNVANLPQHPEDKKFQFDVLTEDGVQLGFMLNTDMELAFDLDVNKTAGTQCIVHKTCKAALTMPLVKTYSELPEKFMTDFSLALSKMVEHGNEGLLREVRAPRGRGDGSKWEWLL